MSKLITAFHLEKRFKITFHIRPQCNLIDVPKLSSYKFGNHLEIVDLVHSLGLRKNEWQKSL